MRADMSPDEADRCPHCGAFLQEPPRCCPAMISEYEAGEADPRPRARYDEDDEVSFDDIF